MKIFIDFDDVIFNTRDFKNDLKNLFVKHGISLEVFEKYYINPLDNREIKTFNPWVHAELIGSDIGLDISELTGAIDKFIENISPYIFSDVNEFAKSIGKKNIYIVSFGDLDFQNKKVRNSRVDQFIDKIFITQNSKSEIISGILHEEKNQGKELLFFLDDRIEQIRDVKEHFPDMVTILVKRPEGRYQEMRKEKCCDWEVKNLKEAENIIKKIMNAKM